MGNDKFLKYIKEKKRHLKKYRVDCICNDRYDIMVKIDSELDLLKEIKLEYLKTVYENN